MILDFGGLRRSGFMFIEWITLCVWNSVFMAIWYDGMGGRGYLSNWTEQQRGLDVSNWVCCALDNELI